MLNKKKIYENQIADKVNELKKACYDAGIPMFFSCAIADNGKITEYKSEMVSALAAKTKLSNDRIALFVNVMNGCKVVHAEEVEEIEF